MSTELEQSYWEQELLKDALEALAGNTGVSGRLLVINEQESQAYKADALIEFETNAGRHQYVTECKSNADRRALIAQVRSRFVCQSRPGLLIAPYVSREIAEHCRESGLQFIDTHGNAYLNAPGMYVYVKGEKSPTGRQSPRLERGATNPTASRIIFTLLCRPRMVRASYREIVESAGVSLGAIGRVFDDLERRGLITGAEKAADRQLLEPKRLLDEWVINYPAVLRPKLAPRRFRAPDPDQWTGLHLDDLGAVWGGEVAAEILTEYLKPATQTIYVDPEKKGSLLTYLVANHRLKPDPHGPIEILDKFWNFPPSPGLFDIAPPILVYADLIATFDPRNSEVANMISEKFIETAFHPG